RLRLARGGARARRRRGLADRRGRGPLPRAPGRALEGDRQCARRPARGARPAGGDAMSALIVLAKAPRPGRVKTRLCPPCTPAEAAALAEAALRDTLAAVAATPAERRVLALDGPVPSRLARGFEVI